MALALSKTLDFFMALATSTFQAKMHWYEVFRTGLHH